MPTRRSTGTTEPPSLMDEFDDHLQSDAHSGALSFNDDDDLERIGRMHERRKSPKIKRRKRRSKMPVAPIIMLRDTACDDKDTFFLPVISREQIYERFQESTLRIQRATDRFLDTIESLKGEIGSVMDLYSDQGHPVSNEMKDAIDEGFSGLTVQYEYYYLGAQTDEMDLTPLGEHTKVLLLAFLALPPLATNFCEVACMCGELAQYFGPLLATEDHAVALFHNVTRYLKCAESLELLTGPMEVLFTNKRYLLKKLRYGRMRELEACRGTHMYDFITW